MSRFVDNKDTVVDTRTGLMWTRDAALSDFPVTWREGLAFVEDLNQSGYCGHSDWKLPNRKELFSLVSHDRINPALPPGHPFINVFNSYYWTSTSVARLPDQAWYVHLGGARMFKGMKHGSYMVWPVRVADSDGGQILPTGQRHCCDENGNHIDCQQTGQDGEYRSGRSIEGPRFKEDGPLVYDFATQRTWLKDANFGLDPVDWDTALVIVETMNSQNQYGHSDWRLPDIRELEGLTDMGRHAPALPEDALFDNIQDFYWSATTSQYDAQYAWVLYLIDGAVGVGYKALSEFFLWPVRDRT